jgi:hypothetical protein
LPSAPRSRQPAVRSAGQESQPVGHHGSQATGLSPLGLPIFDQAVTERIDALRAIIVQDAHGHPKKWSQEEDELLELLRDQGVSDTLIPRVGENAIPERYRVLTVVALKHYVSRSLHACESNLRRKRRPLKVSTDGETRCELRKT